MNYYGKAEAIATKMVKAMEAGTIPEALAKMFINVAGSHSDGWSWFNRLMTAFAGHNNAMGYGAKDKSSGWLSVGRQVRKGEKSFTIFAPKFRKVADVNAPNGKRSICYGFIGVAAFGIDQTDIVDADLWAKHNIGNEAAETFRQQLPFLDVAESWGLVVNVYNAKKSRALGWYRHGQAIAVGVENLATWAHELIHAADDRNGKLVEVGQHWRSETVAELGGAVLMMMMGYEKEADMGGAWEYISNYAKAAKIEPVKACMDVLSRTCEAVSMILEEADKIEVTSDSGMSLGTIQSDMALSQVA